MSKPAMRSTGADVVGDPMAAFFLLEGNFAVTKPAAIDAMLTHWAMLALPQGGIPGRLTPDKLTVTDLLRWAAIIRRSSTFYNNVGVGHAGHEGVRLDYLSPKSDRYVSYEILVGRRGAHGARGYWWRPKHALAPLPTMFAPHWRDIEEWTDPTPIELESIGIVRAARHKERLPLVFGIGSELEWNLCGVEWPRNLGGVIRHSRGAEAVATVPCILIRDALAHAREALGPLWRVDRLSALR